MDAKDLRIESAPTPSDHNNDGSKYAQSGSVLQCNRNKSYQDIGSNSLAKVDVPTARPCAVIGPDRVIPPAVTNDAYLKKGPVEPWPCYENTYRRPPENPHRFYQSPTRNISPRQTFQENMPRIMVPPTFSSVKVNNDPDFALIPDRNVSQSKNTKLSLPPEAKYCDVPYSVNPLTNDQKITQNSDISVTSVNPAISRTAPQGWPPGSVNLRPTRVYGAPELYQYPEYPSCAGPRSVPISRPHRTVQENPANYVYSDPYYHEANIRFKPYPIPKDIQRYPQPRYEYIGNYSNPFHPPPPFPPYKYELQKPIHSHPYQAYPHLKYLEGRIPDPLMEGYQRSSNQQANYNMAYRNQIIHPPYGPVLSNAPQNKMHPYPDSSMKSIASNKLPYENNNKMYLEHENARNKAYPTISDNFYLNDMSRVQPIRSQVIMANYPSVNMHPMQPYYKKENPPLKNYDYMSHFKSMDPSITINNSLLRHPSRFSPSSIAISPSDSNTSIDTLQNQGTLQEDCGYVSQSSSASARSIDTGINRIPNDYYKKYDYRYGPVMRHPSISKPEINHNSNTGSKSKKGIDVRQFFQMWNEGEDENNENSKEIIHAGSNDKNNAPKQHEANSQEQLYVLGLVNVPSEELGKYEHIQQVSKLPENIKGYSSIELLNQFEDAIESSNINCHNPPTPREFSMLGKATFMKQSTGIMHRPLSPLDVEAKISQSVIHKEVGCNFEIKPCSPKMLNVEMAAPVHNILGERLIEKVANPLMIRSPILNGDKNIDNYAMKRQDHRLSLNEKVQSCKMANTQFSSDHSINSMKTNYSLHDLESNSGVCLASLPRLDNDIELSFPEVNQQFINANKGESAVSLKDLPDLESTVELQKTTSMDKSILQERETVQQFSLLHETEKEFIKLSKYRKSKASTTDLKDEDLHLPSKVVRTDSVIIKNPDNIKSYEDSFGCTNNVPFENQQTPINLSSHYNIINKVADENKFELPTTNNSNGHKTMPNDVAIDFSLNKQANNILNNYVEMKKNNESVEQQKYTENEMCEEFDNQLTKPLNENFDDELRKNNNTINDIIMACDENVNQTGNYSDLLKKDKYLGENDIVMENLITNSEKCVLSASSSFIESVDSREPQHDNINSNIPINSPMNFQFKAKTNSNDLFQNNNDLECTSTIDESDVTQNKVPEVINESKIDKAIEPKEDYLGENHDIVENNLFHMTSHEVIKKNDEQELANNSKLVDSNAIQNNSSEVLAEREIDQTISSNKEDSSYSENQDVIENNMFHVNADGLFKSNNDEEYTSDPTLVEREAIQKNLSEILAENELDQKIKLNKEEMNLTLTSQKDDSLLFENQGVIGSTERGSKIFDGNNSIKNTETVIASILETKDKDLNPSNENHKFSSDVQMNLLEVGPESKNCIQDEAKSFTGTSSSHNSQQITPEVLVSSEICSDEAERSPNSIDTLYVTNEAKSSPKPIDTSSVINEAKSTTKSIDTLSVINEGKSSPKPIDTLSVINEAKSSPESIDTLSVINEAKSSPKSIETSSVINEAKSSPKSIDTLSLINEAKSSPKPIDTSSVINEAKSSPESIDTLSVINEAISSPKSIDTSSFINEGKSSPKPIDTSSVINEAKSPPKSIDTLSIINEAKNSSNTVDTLSVNNQYLLLNEQNNTTGIQNIENTNYMQDSTYEDGYEEGQKCKLLSGTVDRGNAEDKTKEKSEVYVKCSKALYSPWVQKLLLYHEGRCSDQFDALKCANDSSAIEPKLEESYTNTKLKSICNSPIRNVDLIKDATMPNMTHVFFNDMKRKETRSDESELSKPESGQTREQEIDEAKPEIEFQSEKDNPSICDDIEYRLKFDTNNASIGNADMKINCFNDNILEPESQSLFQTIQNVNDSTHLDEDSVVEEITEVYNDTTELIDEKIRLESKREPREFLFKNRLSLKRSLSDSALNVYKNDCSRDSDNPLKWPFKRKKMCNTDDRVEANLIAENVCKILQNNRRNSISSSIYNEENVSICIFIDNNCIITEENEVEEKVCYTELPDDCLPESSDSVNEEQNTDYSTEDTSCFEQKGCEFIPFNQCPILQCGEGGKDIEESWVDDVACVETVVSDDIAEDIEISDPTSPKDTDTSDNDESGFFSNNISDHTDKVKYIYGDKMCSDDAELVEKLYRTPQMNVNKTLINKEFHANEEYNNYYDKESLEKILSDSNSPCTSAHTDSTFLFDNPIKTPDDKENVDIGNLSPSLNKYNYGSDNDIQNEMKDINNEYSNFIHEKMQDVTVNSCESSIDNVFTYKQRDETNSFTSSSPEVSSTTSEERNSSILLKITNYKGAIVSQINNVKSENIIKSNSKFTEQNDFVNSCPNLPTNRPLITKAAQKYIPPLKESIRDLKVKLSLPQHSLIKLKQMKISKDEPKLNKHISVPKTSKKPKPKFEDVLKSIDEIQFKMHKEKSKKVKKTIPKVVIKKTLNGSHYASTSNKDVFNPDLTGRKWQPWVFLEKNNFIDKMATKKNTRAIFNHRKNTYVLAEKFRKYKSVSSTKFVISQPKFDDSSNGHLKYTIRLKQSY